MLKLILKSVSVQCQCRVSVPKSAPANCSPPVCCCLLDTHRSPTPPVRWAARGGGPRGPSFAAAWSARSISPAQRLRTSSTPSRTPRRRSSGQRTSRRPTSNSPLPEDFAACPLGRCCVPLPAFPPLLHPGLTRVNALRRWHGKQLGIVSPKKGSYSSASNCTFEQE